jgi:restriction system protein|tara:strand:+ start:146 stop:1486 length:1341 start_codon:yes stop_codon:yes gene_type:complete
MGLPFRKSNEEKIQKSYIKVQLKILHFLNISKKQNHFENHILKYILKRLNINSDQGPNIIIRIHSFINAEDIELEINQISKNQKFSNSEKIDFTDVFLSTIQLLEDVQFAVKEYDIELTEKKLDKILDALKKDKIKKEDLLESFGIGKKIGIFKIKVYGGSVFEYYALYSILKKYGLLDILHNFIKKEYDFSNFEKPNTGVLQGLILSELQNNNNHQISIPITDSQINIVDLKIPLSGLQSTVNFEKIILAKNDMKHKIEEFYDSKTIEDYLIGFLNIAGDQWLFQINYIVQIIKEKNPMWNENIFQLLITKEHEMQISGLKKSLSTTDFPDVDFMDGLQFEKFLGDLFEKMGYAVTVTKASGDQGTDLIIKKKLEIISVQAKRYSDKVTNKAVQEVVGSLKFYNATRGMVVTTNDFTKSAQELAKSNNVELINREELDKMIQQYW